MTQITVHTHSHSHGAHTNGPFTLVTWFSQFAQTTAIWSGHPTAFLLALTVIVAWIVSGPLFNYSDSWQLVINTGTTIVTFLMVFLIRTRRTATSWRYNSSCRSWCWR